MIELKNVNKYYGAAHILNDVTLHVPEGEIYGLIGKNGAGKTTIFKIVLGLTRFSDGTLSLMGSDGMESLRANRRKVGFFIGQNFFDYMTPKQNLEYYRIVKGISDKSEVGRVLKLVDLHNVDKPFKSFSMGMKQRLGIANALLGNPKLLILDEPTNGLDPQGIADIRRLVKHLNETEGMTIIVSSHILNELEHTANRFGIIHGGRLLKEITHEDLKQTKSSVELDVDDVEKAKAVLSANDIRVIGERTNSKSLENFYFELVGGRDV